MLQRWAQRLAWVIFGISLALLVPIAIFAVLNRHEPDIWAITEPQGIAGGILASGVGLLLALRRPGNAIGWILLAMAFLTQIADLLMQWSIYRLAADPDAHLAAATLWGSFALLGLAGTPALTYLLLLFPSGRFPDRRAWIVAILSFLALGTFVFGLIGATGEDLPESFPEVLLQTPNPLPDVIPFADPAIGIITLGLCGLLSIGLLLGRFLTARGIERQQYKWVVLAMACEVVLFVLDFLVVAFGSPLYVITSPAAVFATSLIPIAMAIAILRFHLFNINRVISRALGYALLTLSLVAAYLLLVIGGGSIVRGAVGTSSSLVTAAATLAVAALFRPLRSSIQARVDRRFNRKHYDAARTIEAFTSRLRDDIDLGAVSLELQTVVFDTMQPAYLALWLRPTLRE